MTCRTILLRDDTAAQDELGACQRVVDGLIDVFKNDTGGRAIGLEGAWGSGKSSIVDFVRRDLHPDGRFELVVFDAWAHEGDPLRRSFLEELSDKLKDRRWISSHRHEQLRRDLRERRPRLGLGAMLFGISALLVPAGVALLGECENSPWWSLGLALSLSPLLVLLVGLLVVWRSNGDAASLMSAVVPNASAASESMGATSIEFSEHFDDLLRAALLDDETSAHPAPETRRLIIVIDNLDRVDGTDARAIWRTLQAFVHRRPDPPFDRVWVLVPYDRDRIDEWSHLTPEDGGTDGFLSKSFAARFTVPPPVLGDWKKFLIGQLAEAMPDHNKGEWHTVYRAFDARRSSRGQEPTAREIKECVNAVGTIHRQWGDRYPLAHVACFVLARNGKVTSEVEEGGVTEEIETSLPELLQMADDTLAPAWLMTSKLRENLAGLWFNREPLDAVEILLSTGIENAILRGDGERLRKIHENFSAAPSVLEKVVDELAVEEPAQLLLVARAIVEAGLANTLPDYEKATIQRTLRKRALEIQSWTPEALHAQGAVALLRFCGKNPAQKLFRALNVGLMTLSLTPTVVDSWIANLLVLLKGCETIGVPLVEQLRLVEGGNDSGAVWLAIMKQDPTGRFWRNFSVNGLTPEGLQKEVGSGFRVVPPVEWLAAMVAIDDEHASREWERSVSTISQPLLQGPRSSEPQDGQQLLRIHWLWVLAQHGSSAAQARIVRIAPKVLAELRKSDLPLAWGVALELLMTAPPGGALPAECEDVLLTSSGHEKFHELLTSWQGGQRIIPYVRRTGNYTPVMRDLVQDAAQRKLRSHTQITADLLIWKRQVETVDATWAKIAEDAQLSEEDLI